MPAHGALARRARARSTEDDRNRFRPSSTAPKPMAAPSTLSFFVILRDQPVEKPDAECGRTLRHGGGILCRPGRTSNIEMRPRDVVDKPLQKLRANDASAGATAADVFYVGGIAVDLAVIAFGERQPPDLLADGLAGLDQPVGEFIIIREQAGTVVPERDDDGACQGRQVDHQLWLE